MSPGVLEQDFRFLSLEQAQAPTSGSLFACYRDSWWLVHPEKGLAFYNPVRPNGRRKHPGLGKPQCNTDRRIQQIMFEGIEWPHDCQLVAAAFVPVSRSEICDNPFG